MLAEVQEIGSEYVWENISQLYRTECPYRPSIKGAVQVNIEVMIENGL